MHRNGSNKRVLLMTSLDSIYTYNYLINDVVEVRHNPAQIGNVASPKSGSLDAALDSRKGRHVLKQENRQNDF